MDGHLSAQPLSALLSAIALDSTVSNKIKGSPDVFLDNLNQLVDTVAAAQLQEELGFLKEAFLGVSGAEIFQVPNADPFVNSITGHQWLLLRVSFETGPRLPVVYVCYGLLRGSFHIRCHRTCPSLILNPSLELRPLPLLVRRNTAFWQSCAEPAGVLPQ